MFQALLATEKQEKIELQGQVADLRCALSDALGFRQNCHELEKEVRRLKNSGAETAALYEGIQPCALREWTQHQDLN